MTLEEFIDSLNEKTVPPGLGEPLEALWRDGSGDWDGAHSVAQDLHDERGSRIHAYLHRKEGDLSNAGYWYARAGREPASGPLDVEWTALVRHFLEH